MQKAERRILGLLYRKVKNAGGRYTADPDDPIRQSDQEKAHV
jgi:hypothetical protein